MLDRNGVHSKSNQECKCEEKEKNGESTAGFRVRAVPREKNCTAPNQEHRNPTLVPLTRQRNEFLRNMTGQLSREQAIAVDKGEQVREGVVLAEDVDALRIVPLQKRPFKQRRQRRERNQQAHARAHKQA